METIRRNRRLTIIAFLLSLLFHAGIFIYLLFLQQTDQLNTQPLATDTEELKKEIKKDESWAETKARAGNSTSPVFFEDKPHPQAPAETDQETEPEKPDLNEPENENPDEASQTKESEIQPTQQPEAVTIQRPRRTRVARDKKEQPAQEQVQKPVSPTTPIQPHTTTPKKLPTLAQLTQGFMNHVQEEGKHLVSMCGPKKGAPSDEQLKYERYLQKLNECFSNSLAIHRERFTITSAIEDDTHIYLALNRDGRPQKITLRQSSGNKELDAFMLFIFRDAGTSFPPVPHYLPHDPFTINCIIPTKTKEESNVKIFIR